MGRLAPGLVFAAFGLAYLAGCTSETSIRDRAASEMNCPADELLVEPGFGPSRRVYGCGRSIDMVCSSTLRGEKSAFNGMTSRRNGDLVRSSGCVPQDENP